MPDFFLGAQSTFGVPEILLLIGALLIIIGLVLAFRGRKIWAGLMSLIGAVIGGTLGFLFGMLLNSWIVALILSMVGAFIGSLIFGYIVKIALAFVTALLVAGLVYIVIGPGADQDMRIIVSAVVLIIAYALAYWFVQEIITLITALLGGILLGVGVYLVGMGAFAALALGALVFFVGFILQTVDYRKEKKRRAARATTQSYYVYEQRPPPPPPPPPGY